MSTGNVDETKTLRIGAVCKLIEAEFPDISISKIRYLEDQKLLDPERTNGGYRVYRHHDVERLRKILRMQRDEFLPLRVIRQELLLGGDQIEAEQTNSAEPVARSKRQAVSLAHSDAIYPVDTIINETGVDQKLLKELEDFGLIKGQSHNGVKFYDQLEKEVIRSASELAKYGVAGRNLRILRSSVDRESALFAQILAASLRSHNPQRREEAIEALENLAAVAAHLKHLLLVQDLKQLIR